MKKAYRCQKCGKEVIQDEGMKTPECCGGVMQEISLAACRDAGPEAARPGVAEEPCEDFTGNQN